MISPNNREKYYISNLSDNFLITVIATMGTSVSDIIYIDANTQTSVSDITYIDVNTLTVDAS